MGWQVVRRKLGKAGGLRERQARQRGWDRRYGEGQWSVGYVLDGEFISYEEALEEIYQASYDAFLDEHPELVDELCALAKVLRNPHAEATSGADLQVPALMDYLRRHDRELCGEEVVDIGTWGGEGSHAIGVQLSPLQIPCVLKPKMTLERYWQKKKCLAVWRDA